MLIHCLGTTFQRVPLHKVEDAGVWIECQAATDAVLANAKITMAPKSMVFFVPWTSISFIMCSQDVPSISSSVL
jgi:hypothetical protein